MIEKWVLFLAFTSPHVTTSNYIPMATEVLCKQAEQQIIATFNESKNNRNTHLMTDCIRTSRHTPDDRLKDIQGK